MHELSIANSVLEAVRTEVDRRPGARALKVGVRIGELAGVDPDALRFSFEVLVRGTDLEPLALEIEPSPRRQRCGACGRAFTVVDYDVACPDCGAADTQCLSGDELELTYLEMEQP